MKEQSGGDVLHNISKSNRHVDCGGMTCLCCHCKGFIAKASSFQKVDGKKAEVALAK
jgi:hypothetical protein